MGVKTYWQITFTEKPYLWFANNVKSNRNDLQQANKGEYSEQVSTFYFALHLNKIKIALCVNGLEPSVYFYEVFYYFNFRILGCYTFFAFYVIPQISFLGYYKFYVICWKPNKLSCD